MINFRYHLVSVTAVFLALAIGLILGTTALNGPTMDALSERVTSLSNDKEQLRGQVDQLEEDTAKDQDFATEVAPATLAGTLKGENIVVVGIGDADPKNVKGVTSMLDHTRGTGVGQLTLTDEFTDPDNGGKLTDLVAELTPKNFEPPNNNDGVESVSALLAAGIMTGSKVKADDRDAVVKALSDLDMLTIGSELAKQASAMVIVTGEPYSDAQAADRNGNILTFVDQFGKRGPTVLASPTIVGDGNVVQEVIANDSIAEHVSTVDNVSGPEGQLSAVLAISERLDGGTGHYGTGDEATALVPESP